MFFVTIKASQLTMVMQLTKKGKSKGHQRDMLTKLYLRLLDGQFEGFSVGETCCNHEVMPERLIFMGNDGNRHGFHFHVEGGLGWFYPIDPLFRRERTTFVASLLLLCFMENLHVLCYLKLNLYIWHDTFLVAHLTARIIHNMTIWNIEGGKGREMLKWDEFVQLSEAGLATWGVETRQGTSTS